MMLRVYLFYCLSGLLSIAYQVAWFRIYVDRFGATNITFALVTCCFILGLGLGGLISRSVSMRLNGMGIRDHLRQYGLLELGIALAALLTLGARQLPQDLWGSFPYGLSGNVFQPTLGYQISELVLAAVCVFLPCVMMGTTFPLLCDVFKSSSTFPSSLYAWNTLGACCGVIACQVFFLPRIGHDRTFLIVAVVNGLLGGYFLLTGGSKANSTDASDPVDADVTVDESADESDDGSVAPIAYGTLVFLAVLSGLLAGGLEGDMIKRVSFLGGHTSAAMAFVSFWAILAIFLASCIVRARPKLQFDTIRMATLIGIALYMAAWQFAYTWRSALIQRDGMAVLREQPQLEFTEQGISVHFPSNLMESLLDVMLFVFPAFLCVSLLFPWICNRAQSQKQHVGVICGANTVAFCAGLVLCSVITPRVNIFFSLKYTYVFACICVTVLWCIPLFKPISRWLLVSALACAAVATMIVPRSFDARYMHPGSDAAKFPVRAVKSNGAHTTFVVENPHGDILYFDSHAMSAAAANGQIYMRLMAHFPLLAHPDPEKALVICFGVGNTASAIGAHDTIKQLDIVDLNQRVFETAPEFANSNRKIYQDPRVRLIHDDGRNFLNVTDQKYDLITSEPPPPMHPGIYRLYSQEYYQSVRECLTPQGMFTQWVPTYQMPQDATNLVISTFLKSFPNTLMFTGQRSNYILVGSDAPIDLATLERRFGEQPEVLADLQCLAIPTTKPAVLLARIVQSDSQLRELYGDLGVISDQNNPLSYLFSDPRSHVTIDYDPLRMRGEMKFDQLKCRDELWDLTSDLGKLTYWIRDFPANSLATVHDPSVRYAGVDWEKVKWAQSQFSLAQQQGQVSQAIRISEEIQKLADHLPDQQQRDAHLYMRASQLDTAERLARDLIADIPDSAASYSLLGSIQMRQGKSSVATQSFEKALRFNPYDAESNFYLGRIALAANQVDEAIERTRRALRARPNRPIYRASLGEALVRSGQTAEGIAMIESALHDQPTNSLIQTISNEARKASEKSPFDAEDIADRESNSMPQPQPTVADPTPSAADPSRRKTDQDIEPDIEPNVELESDLQLDADLE